MIFKTAYKKGDRVSVKIGGLDGEGEKWASTSEAVYNYAKKTFKDGDEVTVEFTKKGSAYYVSRITRPGAAPAETAKTEAPKSTATTEYKCSDCGKALKDGKYQKCYECNQKNPAPKQTKTGTETGRTDAVGKSIERQAVLKASANAVATAMQGQVSDMATLGAMISELFDILIKKI